MKPYSLFTFLFVTLFFPSLQLLAEVDPPETEMAGRTVSMELVKAEDVSPASWPNETIALTTQIVITKAGDNIFKLLAATGIRTDTEAYTLIYDLNPNITTLDPLPPNTKLILPKVVGHTLLRQALGNGHLVMLAVDAKAKTQLRSETEAIKELSARFAKLKSGRFADETKKQETINYVQELSGWLELISKTIAQRKAPPLRKATLLQIVNEAEVLRTILERALASKQKMSATDQAQISAIQEDFDELIKTWDQTMQLDLPPAEPQFNVVVEIKGGDADRIKYLRVYYVANGQFRDPPTNPPVRSANFNGLGAESSVMLPIKKYKIWAAKDGDPGHRLTPPTLLLVKKPPSGNTIRVELSLEQ